MRARVHPRVGGRSGYRKGARMTRSSSESACRTHLATPAMLTLLRWSPPPPAGRAGGAVVVVDLVKADRNRVGPSCGFLRGHTVRGRRAMAQRRRRGHRVRDQRGGSNAAEHAYPPGITGQVTVSAHIEDFTEATPPLTGLPLTAPSRTYSPTPRATAPTRYAGSRCRSGDQGRWRVPPISDEGRRRGLSGWPR